ncbi:MAG: LPP20 family lipoprotein, partial [Bacteroidota bacterium]
FLFGQAPEWVKNYGKSSQYPDQRYLTGFGISKVTKELDREKSLQRSTDAARAHLVQTIRVRIQATVGSTTVEQNQKVSSYFSSALQASTSLELQGLGVESFFDDDEEISYALAFVAKGKLANGYGEKETALRKEIRQRLEAGKKFELSGTKGKALEEYLACYPLFRQLEEAQAILLAVRTTDMNVFDELEGNVARDEVPLSEVRESIQRLLQHPLKTPEDLAWYLLYNLKEQSGLKEATVLVAPFTYQDTRMGSPFSRYFKQLLDGKVTEVAKWTRVEQVDGVQLKTQNIMRELAEISGATYVLKGTYWEQPQGLKLIATLQRTSDSRLIGSAEALIHSGVTEGTGTSIKPQNFQSAFHDQQAFNKDELIGGGLSLEVWTNKGVDDVVFTKGERMNVYVRVNLPCYVRFLYHLADGKRTMLLDNYYIDESKVNMVVQIPDEFECDSPYGAEVLQAFARTEAFEPLETVKTDGYTFLKQDLGK